MAYTDEQRQFYSKAKAAGWDDSKIRAGLTRLGERAQSPQTGVPGQAPAAPGAGVQPAPTAPTGPQGAPVDDGTAWMEGYSPTDDMSGGQRFLAGAGKAVSDTMLGGRQRLAELMGDKEAQARLQQEAIGAKGRDEALLNTAGGLTGNIAGYVAPLIATGGKVGAPGVMNALARMGVGGVAGAAQSALTPTTEEGELESNMKFGGTLGAVLPGVGAALRSAPFKAATNLAKDWNPLYYTKRLDKRNTAGRLANQVERDQSAAIAQQQTMAAKQAEKARVAQANAVREAGLESARKEIANRAGWSTVPKNELELEQALSEVGGKLTASLKPVRMFAGDAAEKAAARAAKEAKTGLPEAKQLEVLANRMNTALNKQGNITGETYQVLRADITEMMKGSSGPYKRALKESLKDLDASLKGAVRDPKKIKEIETLRDQYSVGSKLSRMQFDPSKPMDVNAARKALKKDKRDPTGLREYLTEVKAATPPVAKEAKVARVAPARVDKFKPELSNIPEMATINLLLGAGTGGAHLGIAPTMSVLRQGAKNKPTANTLSALLRGWNLQNQGE